MIEIVLYTKENCSLCRKAEATLESLAPAYAYRLTEVDITSDPALYERYRFRIPVFLIGGQELEPPIERAGLIQALEAASRNRSALS